MFKMIAVVGLAIAGIYGWMVNLVVLYNMNAEAVGELIVRTIGVIVPFIGAVLGYI